MSITVPGFAPDDARPGSFRVSNFGAGRLSVASTPMKVLCLGNKTSAGSATADQDVIPIGSEADADAYLGYGSECATTCYAALSIPGVTVYAAPVAEPVAGPVASTITLAFGGTATRNGTLRGSIAGKDFSVGIATTDATTLIATNCTLAINSLVRAQVTATTSTSSTVVTNRNTGARGNQLLLSWDSSDVPGITVTVTGGTAIHSNLVPFTSGAGTDSVTNVLALLTADTYNYLASPHNDATNMGLIKTHMATEAGAGISHLEHAIFAIFGTYAAATALSTSTLNDPRSTLVWSTYLENSPAWFVGKIAAKRASVVGQQPNYKWGLTPICTIEGAKMHSYAGDRPGGATQKNALNNGLCVLTSLNGNVVLVRGITTKCLTGSAADFRARDWAAADVTDRVNMEMGSLWTEVSEANPYMQPDATDGSMPPPETITPSSWAGNMLGRMLELQAANMVYLVRENPPLAEWDNTRKCIMSAVPSYEKPKSYQAGVVVNQTVA
jgi:phage tail sheath gpL-like